MGRAFLARGRQGPARAGRDDRGGFSRASPAARCRHRRDQPPARTVPRLAARRRELPGVRPDRSQPCRRALARLRTEALPETVRALARGKRVGAEGDRRDRGRGHRLDGRRHPDGRALAADPPAVRPLPPGLRPGHQSADRSAARAAGHVAGDSDRPGAQHLRTGAGERAADPAQFAGALAAQAAPDPGARPNTRTRRAST